MPNVLGIHLPMLGVKIYNNSEKKKSERGKNVISSGFGDLNLQVLGGFESSFEEIVREM